MTAIPLRRRAKRLNETTGLVRPILAALNRLPYVQAWRNSTGALRDSRGALVTFGLAVGSSDIVGIVTCDYPRWDSIPEGRFFCLEVKVPGKKPTDDQLRWLAIVRKMGGFAAWVTSLDAALACAGRARDPRISE